MGNRLDVDLPEYPLEIVFVLVQPEFPGNIGAVCRGMLNFGFDKLRVIGHDGNWEEETRKRAKHAQSVLDNAKTYDNWDSCMEDVSLVIGTSGKRELGAKIQFRHFLTPKDLIENLEGLSGRVAIVFGPEGIGLLQDQLRLCDLLLTIPTWEGYPILNLSHAVTVVAYSMHQDVESDSKEERAMMGPKLRGKLRETAARIAESLPIHDSKKRGAREQLIRTLMRSSPDEFEAHRLLGILNDAADALEMKQDISALNLENPEE
ncbi:MAG: RNA methyltransferase [Candidatus Thermoplasmatota archaeon]|nr:RNA methyltransferase [Candidatus Thermoplasmatota archaeon]